MKLHTIDEIPSLRQGFVCRQSRLATLFTTAIMGGMLIGLPAFLIWQFAPPWWCLLIAAGIGGLIARWLVGIVVSSGRRENWVLRISPDGLWISLRSYLNHKLPPGRTIVHLPYDEIAYVSERVQKRAEDTGDGKTEWTDRYLEIHLVEAAPSELRAELAEERRRDESKSHFGGLVTSRSRNGHTPVTVPSDGVIRIAWRGRHDWVSPSLRHTLRQLQGRVSVRETTRTDFSNVSALSSEEVDRLTLELVESGDKMGAMKLLATRRGYSTTEAHKFVEELTAVL